MRQAWIELIDHPIDLEKLSTWLGDASCGAEVQFVGKVRNHNEGKQVLSIEYQAYREMALSEMKKIVNQARTKWAFQKCGFVHRLGQLGIGEVSVALFISSPHRKEAFEACQWMIVEMKKHVPIWKKEFYQDGSHWLA